MVKNLPEMQETQVRSLSREDPLEEEMTTHSCILGWEIPDIMGQGSLTVRVSLFELVCAYYTKSVFIIFKAIWIHFS